ncbi:hypothetical protein AB0L06_22900 [Spirillospora sp. NPDC052269]
MIILGNEELQFHFENRLYGSRHPVTLDRETNTFSNDVDVSGVVIEVGNSPGSVDSVLGAVRVLAGECVTWALPPDESCAAVARRYLRGVMAELGVADELVYDASTMVSELAGNVFLHALGGVPRAPALGAPAGALGVPAR